VASGHRHSGAMSGGDGAREGNSGKGSVTEQVLMADGVRTCCEVAGNARIDDILTTPFHSSTPSGTCTGLGSTPRRILPTRSRRTPYTDLASCTTPSQTIEHRPVSADLE